MEKENEKKDEDVLRQSQKKETFEPLDMKVVDVKVEKGYATSGHSDPVTIQQWEDGSW